MSTQQAYDIFEADAAIVNGWLSKDEALLVDVREANEIEAERIPGAIFMPMSYFDAEHFPRIPGKNVVLMCAIGKRSLAAARQLAKIGYHSPIHLKGGLAAWKEAGFATEL